MLFGLSFGITYTCARTLALYYRYGALKTGLVLLSFGIGPYHIYTQWYYND